MAYNKLEITSTFSHHNEIIDLTEDMLVKVGKLPKVIKKRLHPFNINMIKMDLDAEKEAAKNKLYNKLIIVETFMVVFLIIAAAVLGLLS